MSAQDLEQRGMSLAVALDFADNPRPYHSMACPADTNGELYRALKTLAAALRQQPAPVDLEQFRAAVCSWRVDAVTKGKAYATDARSAIMAERVAEADRLLSIIDNAGKVECAEPVAWITPESIRHLAKMNGPANAVVWNCETSDARVPLYTSPHQPAPVVDDAMRELIEADVEYDAARSAAKHMCTRKDTTGVDFCNAIDRVEAARSRRIAALASAQGVQP